MQNSVSVSQFSFINRRQASAFAAASVSYAVAK